MPSSPDAPSTPGPLLLIGGTAWDGSACGTLGRVVGQCGAVEALVLPTGAAFQGTAAAVDHVSRLLGTVDVRELHVIKRDHALDAGLALPVSKARMIVLAGESSIHIRSVLKATPVWEAVLHAWSNGAAIVGIGGAAAVLCDPMIDDRGGAFTIGLGLLSNAGLLPHAHQWGEERMKRTVRLVSRGIALVTVADDAAVCWTAVTGWSSHGEVEVRRDGALIECASLPAPAVPALS